MTMQTHVFEYKGRPMSLRRVGGAYEHAALLPPEMICSRQRDEYKPTLMNVDGDSCLYTLAERLAGEALWGDGEPTYIYGVTFKLTREAKEWFDANVKEPFFARGFYINRSRHLHPVHVSLEFEVSFSEPREAVLFKLTF